jgi:hypothetical protein
MISEQDRTCKETVIVLFEDRSVNSALALRDLDDGKPITKSGHGVKL